MLPKIEHIKQVSKKIGLTQRELAMLSDISTSMINQINQVDVSLDMTPLGEFLKF